MAVTASGEIKLIGDVNNEINGNTTDTNVSLTTLSTGAEKTAPHGLTEFYSYSAAVTPSEHFQTILYTGTGASHVIDGGKFSGGGKFNGSSSKIALATACFNFSAITMSVWVKPSGSGDRVIFENYHYVSSPGSQGIILKIDSSTNKALLRAYNGDCGAAYPIDNSCSNVTEVSSNSAISTSAWTHIAFTLDGSNMKMYINGTAQTGNTSVASNGFSFNASNLTNIGYLKYGSAADEQFYSGKMDQLRVYNSVLSATEVTALYNETLADSYKVTFPTGKTVTALYRFNSSANDETGAYDGTASSVAWEGGTSFTPDLVWVKSRGSTAWHSVIDSIRGGSKRIVTNSNNAETTDVNRITSFDTGGFTAGSDGDLNGSNYSLVGWCWKGAGSNATNNNGSLQSTVRANTEAGFSIVKYDTPHTNATAVRTVGHGLNTAPSLIIVKNLEHASSWFVYSEAVGNTYEMYLHTNHAKQTDGNRWNSTSPTTSVFTLGTNFSLYGVDYYGGETMAYCFHDVAGYQKIGTYNGNGSVNGPIIETGFKPGFILTKNTNTGENWEMFDDQRSVANPRNEVIFSNLDYIEYVNQSQKKVDFLSNGFQIVGSDESVNKSGNAILYLAIAADPERPETPVLADSFNITGYSGTSADQNVTMNFGGAKPDLVWIKNRDANYNHALYDSVRGAEKPLSSNTTAAQDDDVGDSYGLKSFNTNGFRLGNSGAMTNTNGNDFISYGWKAGNKTEILTAGTIDSVVSVNDAAGFSIVKYIGNGSAAQTVAHGLSAAPTFIIAKCIDTTSSWIVYSSTTGINKFLELNDGPAAQSSTNYWGLTTPSTTTFGVAQSNSNNNSTGNAIIAYCWRPISGYSSFGTYEATQSTGSPTITTGFQPDLVIVKNIDRNQEWVMIDGVRGLSTSLWPNSNSQEGSGNSITRNSTSFTINNSGGGTNYADGDNFIYAAFKIN